MLRTPFRRRASHHPPVDMLLPPLRQPENDQDSALLTQQVLQEPYGARDWNAVAVMDALTGRCFVQTFQPPSSPQNEPQPNLSLLPKLVIMGQDRTGIKLGGLYWATSKKVAAFEYDLTVQNPLELQRDLCQDNDESRAAIIAYRTNQPMDVLRGAALRSAITEMQMGHRRMAIWPICLPPPISNVRIPFMLETLEQVLASHVRGSQQVGNVIAYIVCDGSVHTLFNRNLQTYRLSRPVSVHTMIASHPTSIRIFAPNQLKSWLASSL
jgi:hypothetical protein